jgi:beta-lactamase family protein
VGRDLLSEEDGVTLVTLGVGAQASPRYAPAGLLVMHAGVRIVIDGGDRATPVGRLDAWLVTDEQSELISHIRKAARARGLAAILGNFQQGGLSIRSRPVVHTNHPTCGYQIEAAGVRVVWAPEFYAFPRWARGADLMLAEAASWNRPIRFVGGVGGHLDVQAVARAAARNGVRRLVFAHIGRPTLAALDRGLRPPFGEFARDGQIFRPGGQSRRAPTRAITTRARRF